MQYFRGWGFQRPVQYQRRLSEHIPLEAALRIRWAAEAEMHGPPLEDFSHPRREPGPLRPSPWQRRRDRRGYSVEMSPVVVATIQRLPHRTIDSMRPTPGTLSPCFTVQT